MSDAVTESAPVESSAPAPTAEPSSPEPQTTADIATEILRGGEAEPEASVVDEDPADVPGERFTEEEQLLREFGFKRAKDAHGKDHVIPRSRVLEMIASGLKRGKDKWAGERETLAKELAELRDWRDGFRSDVTGDPRNFITKLSGHDPRYAAFLQQQSTTTQQEQPDPMPLPDLDLGNGQRTYSLEGLQKRDEWAQRQMLRQVDEKLKPITEREKTAKERVEAEQAQQALVERTRGQIAQAQTLPNWKDYEPDILKLLQDDTAKAQSERRRPTMTLMEAYWQTRATKARETMLTEIKDAPPAPTVQRSSGTIPKPRQESTADVARSVLRGS